MAQYPHIRVFYDSDGLIRFMSFTDAGHNGQYAEKHIGQDDLLEIMYRDSEGVSLMPYYLIEYLDEMLAKVQLD